MAAISTTFGSGGAGLTPNKSAGVPDLATALRDAADDFAALKQATIAAPALLAFTDPPAAAEMALLRTLVNELRATLIAQAAVVIKTTKA